MTADEWNTRYQVGQSVRYYPITGGRESWVSKTRSRAWTLADNTAVVLVDRRAGCVALDNLKPEAGP